MIDGVMLRKILKPICFHQGGVSRGSQLGDTGGRGDPVRAQGAGEWRKGEG